MLLNIIDTYAYNYGWSRHEILENVYLDEYFMQQEIIDMRRRQHYLMLLQLQAVPNMENKEKREFLDYLSGNDRKPLAPKNVETDLKAIAEAKRRMQNLK